MAAASGIQDLKLPSELRINAKVRSEQVGSTWQGNAPETWVWWWAQKGASVLDGGADAG